LRKVARIREIRNTYQVLVYKPERMRLLEISRSTWADTDMDVQKGVRVWTALIWLKTEAIGR
jgi:hypothetical protein